MIIYALHAICRAINRTRHSCSHSHSNSPTIRLCQPNYPSNLSMHNSLQINGREPSRVEPRLANMFEAAGQNVLQLATKFGSRGSDEDRKLKRAKNYAKQDRGYLRQVAALIP